LLWRLIYNFGVCLLVVVELVVVVVTVSWNWRISLFLSLNVISYNQLKSTLVGSDHYLDQFNLLNSKTQPRTVLYRNPTPTDPDAIRVGSFCCLSHASRYKSAGLSASTLWLLVCYCSWPIQNQYFSLQRCLDGRSPLRTLVGCSCINYLNDFLPTKLSFIYLIIYLFPKYIY